MSELLLRINYRSLLGVLVAQRLGGQPFGQAVAGSTPGAQSNQLGQLSLPPLQGR